MQEPGQYEYTHKPATSHLQASNKPASRFPTLSLDGGASQYFYDVFTLVCLTSGGCVNVLMC